MRATVCEFYKKTAFLIKKPITEEESSTNLK